MTIEERSLQIIKLSSNGAEKVVFVCTCTIVTNLVLNPFRFDSKWLSNLAFWCSISEIRISIQKI